MEGEENVGGCQGPLGESPNTERGQPGVRIGSLHGDTYRKEKGGSVERSGCIGAGQALEVPGVRWPWWSPREGAGQQNRSAEKPSFIAPSFIHPVKHSASSDPVRGVIRAVL